jgi:predicted dehydrogenase
VTRLAVIGVGHLGRHHARLVPSVPGATLVAAVDLVADRAQEAVKGTEARALTDARALLGGQPQVDAVVVAVPTADHLTVALPFLERGIHVLVEKPMAASNDEARELARLAEASKAILAVGQSERFNPAIRAALPILRTPRFIEVHRLSGFPDRSLDIDVVFDLMIHDLDIVLSLVHAEVESIEAVGVPVLTNRVDIANARLRFSNGCIANLTASRISRDRVRKIRFFQPAAYLSIDYAAQKVEVWRLVQANGAMPTIDGGELQVPNEEPLKRELADFVDAVVSGRPPLVTGEQGRRALALATQITAKMTSSTA